MKTHDTLGNPVAAALLSAAMPALTQVFIYGSLAYVAYRWIKGRSDDSAQREAETEAGSPAYQYAQQLSTLLSSWNVQPSAYQAIKSQIPLPLMPKVADLYHKLTGRSLSADEADKISSASQKSTNKAQAANNSPDSTWGIDDAGNIIFKVKPTDYVRFIPNSTTAIPYWTDSSRLLESPPDGYIKPDTKNRYVYMLGTKKLESYSMRNIEGFTDVLKMIVKPVVFNYKKFAIARIAYVTPQGHTSVYVDVTKFIKGKFAQTTKGLGYDHVPPALTGAKQGADDIFSQMAA
jgi:hypothetical protein